MEDTTAIDAKAKSIEPLWKRVIEALGLAAGLIGSVTAIVTAQRSAFCRSAAGGLVVAEADDLIPDNGQFR